MGQCCWLSLSPLPPPPASTNPCHPPLISTDPCHLLQSPLTPVTPSNLHRPPMTLCPHQFPSLIPGVLLISRETLEQGRLGPEASVGSQVSGYVCPALQPWPFQGATLGLPSSQLSPLISNLPSH